MEGSKMAEDKTLDKVQKLLDRANHPETPEGEREACLEKADAMMFRHKIDGAMLSARTGDSAAGRKPVHDAFEWVPKTDEFWNVHSQIIVSLAKLTDVQLVLDGGQDLNVFGYTADVAYFRMLWMSAYLTFSNRLFPRWDSGMTDGQNIKALAESGAKWVAIWREAQKAGALSEVKCPPADNGRMKRLYKRACIEAGEEKMELRHAVQTYRDSYALAFARTIASRCTRLRAARSTVASGTGAELVLRSDADAVLALMRSTYPHLSDTVLNGRPMRGGVEAAAARGAAAGDSVDFSGGGGLGTSNTNTKAIG